MPAQLRSNIRETIGCGIEHEIIVIDNSQNQYNIFQAYNKGVSLSWYSFLLFMHDDVIHCTKGWGLRLADHFQNPEVGCVGTAGTSYLPYVPGAWWGSGIAYYYLLQYFNGNAEPVMINSFPANSAQQEVVILDGIWICIRKEVFNSIEFDGETFNGFHFYDLDITLQAFQAGYKNLCVNDILINHSSGGNFDYRWVEDALLFHNKWKQRLPIATQKYSLFQQCRLEHRALKIWIQYCINSGFQKRAKIYLDALKIVVGFKKGYLYYGTPVLATVIFARYLKNLLLRK